MEQRGQAEELADAATMALVLGWIRSALGPLPIEDSLVSEVYRRVSQDCPRWLRAAPLRLKLKSLTVIVLLDYQRGHPA